MCLSQVCHLRGTHAVRLTGEVNYPLFRNLKLKGCPNSEPAFCIVLITSGIVGKGRSWICSWKVTDRSPEGCRGTNHVQHLPRKQHLLWGCDKSETSPCESITDESDFRSQRAGPGGKGSLRVISRFSNRANWEAPSKRSVSHSNLKATTPRLELRQSETETGAVPTTQNRQPTDSEQTTH